MVKRLNQPTLRAPEQSGIERLARREVASIYPIDASDAEKVEGLADIALSGSASDLDTGTVPAARMPAHTGDVTSSAGAVDLTIANDTVTYAKMQNVSAASKLLGRGDSGSGDPEEITLGTGLSMSGTTLNASEYDEPWTYVKLTSQFSTTSTSLVSTGLSVAGSSFAADRYFEFEAILYVARSGGAIIVTTDLVWPAGLGGGVATLLHRETVSSGTNASNLSGFGSVNTVWAVRGYFFTGGSSPTGNLEIQQKVSAATDSGIVAKGSFLKYRALP